MVSTLQMRDGDTSRLAHIFVWVLKKLSDFGKGWRVVHFIQLIDRVLAHEFTHALVREIASHGVPAWLNEGLATALESGDLGWAEHRVREAGTPVALEALASSFGRLSGGQAQLAYAKSALAVRQMIDEAGGPAVVNLLRDLGDGVSFETAFAHRMQRAFGDFQASLRW